MSIHYPNAFREGHLSIETGLGLVNLVTKSELMDYTVKITDQLNLFVKAGSPID